MYKLRAYMPAMVLLAGCAFIWQTRSQRRMPLAAPLATVLPSVPGYRAEDQHVSDDERKVAGMTDYIARMFVRDSTARDSTVAFTTLVSYYDRQAQGSTIHSPRNCLPGAGWEILRGRTRQIDVEGTPRVVNEYILKKGATTAVAYYWYQGRGRVVANEYRVKWNLLRDAALEGHTEEALVRIVIFPNNAKPGSFENGAANDPAYLAATTLGDDLTRKLMKEVDRVLPGSPARSPAS
jgi:EpsI family protein